MSVQLARRSRPLLAVVYNLGSATPLEIRSAAGRACDVVFVCDFDRPHIAASGARIRDFAKVVDVTGLEWEQRRKAVEDLSPDGVLTFSEYQLVETSGLADALGLPGHHPRTAGLLTDKLFQRRALAQAGVQATGCSVVGADPTAALAAVGLPAVLKPRRGAGSVNTVRVDTAEDFYGALRGMPDGVEFVIEELLRGDPSVAGASWGDYVSVESVHTPTGSRQVCVTGKFPLAEPFRETGMVLPATLSEEDSARVLALEKAVVSALGVRHGITHTEIKLTSDGPRVIEVNGRLGGYVPGILKQATGINLVQVAMQVALGREPRLPEIHWNGVSYQYFLSPRPGETGVLTALDGVEEVAALPGVWQVDVHARPGDHVDWRAGTQSHLGVVHGTASDHEALRRIAHDIATTFRPTIYSMGSSR